VNKKARPTFKIVLLGLLVIAFGAAFFIQNQIADLQRQRQELIDELGDFRNTDVNKIRLLQFDAGNPFQFKWRLILPDNPSLVDHMEFAGGSKVTSTLDSSVSKKKFRRTLGIFFDLDGQFPAIHMSGVSSTRYAFPKDGKLASFLAKNWQDLSVETVGKNQLAPFAPNKTVDLFTLSVPPNLIEKLEQEISGPIMDKVKAGPLFKYSIRPR